MIKYNEVSCGLLATDLAGIKQGYLCPDRDGVYSFFPYSSNTSMTTTFLKEILAKLEDLNNPVLQKILSERETEYPPFTD